MSLIGNHLKAIMDNLHQTVSIALKEVLENSNSQTEKMGEISECVEDIKINLGHEIENIHKRLDTIEKKQ